MDCSPWGCKESDTTERLALWLFTFTLNICQVQTVVLSLISPPSKLWFKAETSQGWRGKHNKHKKETLKLKSSSEAKGQISDLEEKPKDIMQKGKQIE